MANIELFSDVSVAQLANHLCKHVSGITRWQLSEETGESPKAVAADLDLLTEEGYVGETEDIFYPTEDLLKIRRMIPKQERSAGFRLLGVSAKGYVRERLARLRPGGGGFGSGT